MFDLGDVQHTIRDAQYREALKNVNENPPEVELPRPTPDQLERYMFYKEYNLKTILFSPLQVYFFKEYLNNFLNMQIVIDFLLQFEHLRETTNPAIYELENLVFFSSKLPGQYREKVKKIQQQLKLLQSSQSVYEGTEAEDLVIDGEADSLLGEEHFPEHENEGSHLARGLTSPMLRGANHSNKVFSMMQIGEGEANFRTRLVSFGASPPKQTAPKPEARFVEEEIPPSGDRVESMRTSFKNVLTKITSVILPESDTTVESNSRNGDTRIERVGSRENMTENIAEAKETLLQLFDELVTVLAQKAEDLVLTFKESKEFKTMNEVLWASEKIPKESDFRRFRILGKGAFGSVSSVKHKATGQLVALKMLNKKLVWGKSAWGLIEAEKKVLQMLGDNPCSFTVWLKYSFEDEEYVYMALPLCTGGDLLYHLRQSGTFEYNRARFYAAEIFEGLAHLHKMQIIYRDLKPENIILDSEGHCRISDMGLAIVSLGAMIKQKAGTSGYWAPEVVGKLPPPNDKGQQPKKRISKPYTYSADYWSFGVVLFEFFIGRCPFSASYTRKAFPSRDEATLHWKVQTPKKILNGEEDRKLAIPFPSEAAYLLKWLLQKKPSHRPTETEVRNCAFFDPINWEALRQREIPPPFIPEKTDINTHVHIENDDHEKMFANEKLDKAPPIEQINYIAKTAHELDIANMLQMRKKMKHKLYIPPESNEASLANLQPFPSIRVPSVKQMQNKVQRVISTKGKDGCNIV